jgi:hypothetical protein
MIWLQAATAVLAFYAAVLATYAIVAPRIKLQRCLHVRVMPGYLNQNTAAGEAMVVISATNRGQKSITLASTGLSLPRRGPVMFLRVEGDASLPHALAPGKSCRFWIPAHRVSRAIRDSGVSGRARIVGLLTDETDRTYRSRAYRFDRDAYEQSPAEAALPAAGLTAASSAAQEPVAAFKW